MKIMKYFLLLAVLLAALTVLSIFNKANFSAEKNMENESVENNYGIQVKHPAEISGWVAWWKEEEAYDLIEKHAAQITTVSPVWFFINKDLDLVNVGEINRQKTVEDMRNYGIGLVPSLGSELKSEELGLFLNDDAKTASLIDNLIFQLTALGAQGVDVDLEEIGEEDKDSFSRFLFKLSEKLKEKDIKLYVAVHAQTEKVEWEGVLGQDLQKIGEASDFVRIMTYDRHTCSNGPGAISPINWMKEVAEYNSRLIDNEKIIIGIPSYSYVWREDDCISMQFDELEKYLEGRPYTQKRDRESKELIFESDDFTAWLSDSEAMKEKIKSLRSRGFNKFVIWNLGGMDGEFFENDLW